MAMRLLVNPLSRKQYRRYLRQTRRLLTGSAKEKRALMRGLQESLQDYLREYPDAGWYDVTRYFGTPEEWAADAVAVLDGAQRASQLAWRKTAVIRTVAAVILAVVLMVLTVFLVRQHNAAGLQKVRYVYLDEVTTTNHPTE